MVCMISWVFKHGVWCIVIVQLLAKKDLTIVVSKREISRLQFERSHGRQAVPAINGPRRNGEEPRTCNTSTTLGAIPVGVKPLDTKPGRPGITTLHNPFERSFDRGSFKVAALCQDPSFHSPKEPSLRGNGRLPNKAHLSLLGPLLALLVAHPSLRLGSYKQIGFREGTNSNRLPLNLADRADVYLCVEIDIYTYIHSTYPKG